jgi:hypothetical protein
VLLSALMKIKPSQKINFFLSTPTKRVLASYGIRINSSNSYLIFKFVNLKIVCLHVFVNPVKSV